MVCARFWRGQVPRQFGPLGSLRSFCFGGRRLFFLLLWFLWLLLWLVCTPLPAPLAPLMGQRRPYNLPKEPLDFSPHEPNRPNALDLQGTLNGYVFLRYQRATNSRFSFIFDLNGYVYIINLFHLSTRSRYDNASSLTDFRFGAGLGLAFWPWEKLRKAYVALRGQMQFQLLGVNIDGTAWNRRRFLVGSSLEIGGRLGRKVLSAGAFGGIGFQVPTDAQSVLPESFVLPVIYAYLGFSLGLTFR